MVGFIRLACGTRKDNCFLDRFKVCKLNLNQSINQLTLFNEGST